MDEVNAGGSGTFAWRVSFFGSIATLVFLPIIKPDPFLEIYSFLPDGLVSTLIITVGSIICASIISVAVGMARALNGMMDRVLSIYVEVVRGIPLLVQLFYVYFVIGQLISLPREVMAIIAMSVCYGAYMAEIVRAGILAIPKIQMEAALSLGMSPIKAFRYVIMPQAIRIIIPPFGNEFIMLLKDSSLVSIIAVADIMQRTRQYATRTFHYFEAFTVVALMYLILTLFFSKIVAIIEKRVRPRRGGKKIATEQNPVVEGEM